LRGTSASAKWLDVGWHGKPEDVRSCGNNFVDDEPDAGRRDDRRLPAAEGFTGVEARLPAHPVRPDRPRSDADRKRLAQFK